MHFRKRRLIDRQPAADGRQSRLSLTRRGRAALHPLERAAEREVAALLAPLTNPEQERLVESMQTIRQLLDSSSASGAPTCSAPTAPATWVG